MNSHDHDIKLQLYIANIETNYFCYDFMNITQYYQLLYGQSIFTMHYIYKSIYLSAILKQNYFDCFIELPKI